MKVVIEGERSKRWLILKVKRKRGIPGQSRLWAFTVEGMSSVPGQGTRSHMPRGVAKSKKNKVKDFQIKMASAKWCHYLTFFDRICGMMRTIRDNLSIAVSVTIRVKLIFSVTWHCFTSCFTDLGGYTEWLKEHWAQTQRAEVGV